MWGSRAGAGAAVGDGGGASSPPPAAAAPARGASVLRLWSLRSAASRRSADSASSASEPASPAWSSPPREQPERAAQLEGALRALECSSAEASELCAEQGARLRTLGLELEQAQRRCASLEAALCRDRDELLLGLARGLGAAAALALALALALHRRGLDAVAQCGALACGALLALAAESARRRRALPLVPIGLEVASKPRPAANASAAPSAAAGSLVKPVPSAGASEASDRSSATSTRRGATGTSTSTRSISRSDSRPGSSAAAAAALDKSQETAFSEEYKLNSEHYVNFFEGLYSKVEELAQFQEMNEEQRAAFYKLRKEAAEHLPQSKEVDWSKHHILPDDATVLRFLQADKYSVPLALKRLADTVVWMQRMQLNTMVRDTPARLAQYRKCRSRVFLGFDLAGRPVHAERIGEFISGLPRAASLEVSHDDFLACYTCASGAVLTWRCWHSLANSLARSLARSFNNHHRRDGATHHAIPRVRPSGLRALEADLHRGLPRLARPPGAALRQASRLVRPRSRNPFSGNGRSESRPRPPCSSAAGDACLGAKHH
jgi:hypothetical protein